MKKWGLLVAALVSIALVAAVAMHPRYRQRLLMAELERTPDAAERARLIREIIDLDAERGRISLSTKQLEPEPGDMIKNRDLVYDKAEEMAARYREQMAAKQQGIDLNAPAEVEEPVAVEEEIPAATEEPVAVDTEEPVATDAEELPASDEDLPAAVE